MDEQANKMSASANRFGVRKVQNTDYQGGGRISEFPEEKTDTIQARISQVSGRMKDINQGLEMLLTRVRSSVPEAGRLDKELRSSCIRDELATIEKEVHEAQEHIDELLNFV